MIQPVNPEFIKRYQTIYEKDPSSKVFAPLAEAYRKMGDLDKALEICQRGVSKHPDFPSGHVALAKILVEQENYEEALDSLVKVTQLSPENILAHRLLAQSYMKLRRPKDALREFKMILLLNPNDPVAIKNVKRLESLTADDYDEEVFAMKPLERIHEDEDDDDDDYDSENEASSLNQIQIHRTLERYLSLADAFIARIDFENARSTVEKLEELVGTHPEITKRIEFLKSREKKPHYDDTETESRIQPIKDDLEQRRHLKIEFLESMLQRINERRISL